MARIRVNTDDLKDKAKDLETAAYAFNTAGDAILAAAMSMPSYEGQLSGPARAAAYEIQKQSRDVHASLSGDAESLQRTAQKFDDANNQAIDVFTKNQDALLAAGGPGGELVDNKGDRGGSTNFGYQKVGTQYIYLFYQGQTIIIDLNAIDNETLIMVLAFMSEVDKWDTTLSKLSKDDVEKLLEICGKFLLGGISFLSMEITTIFGAIAGAGLWIWMFVDAVDWTKEFQESWDALMLAREKGANDFSWLESTNKPGVSTHPTTDDEINNFNSP